MPKLEKPHPFQSQEPLPPPPPPLPPCYRRPPTFRPFRHQLLCLCCSPSFAGRRCRRGEEPLRGREAVGPKLARPSSKQLFPTGSEPTGFWVCSRQILAYLTELGSSLSLSRSPFISFPHFHFTPAWRLLHFACDQHWLPFLAELLDFLRLDLGRGALRR